MEDVLLHPRPDHEQRIFDYLKDNLTLNVKVHSSSGYYDSNGITVEISLKSPTTGKYEVIASVYESLP